MGKLSVSMVRTIAQNTICLLAHNQSPCSVKNQYQTKGNTHLHKHKCKHKLESFLSCVYCSHNSTSDLFVLISKTERPCLVTLVEWRTLVPLSPEWEVECVTWCLISVPSNGLFFCLPGSEKAGGSDGLRDWCSDPL